MTNPVTYTPEQLNSVVASYEQEIIKLLSVKANKDLKILSLATDLVTAKNTISDLEKKVKELSDLSLQN